MLQIEGTTQERLEKLAELLAPSATGSLGVQELQFVVDNTLALGLDASLDLDVSLARGLNYYTGTIIEVKALDTEMGSITGGGRYDNLTGIFGLPGISGVGISFGADRIYDVLGALDLYPADLGSSTKVLFANFGGDSTAMSMKLVKKLRANGISAEVYPDKVKMRKQIGYADNAHVPYFAVIGDDELAAQKVTVKNMESGEQTQVAFDEIAEFFLK